MKRRNFLHFLHGASWTTIFWGWSQGSSAQADSRLSYLGLGSQTRQNIAAPTARKFALLVGLNHYADPNLLPLAGCLTDLELQRQLLRHRYGFADQDILTLADQTATESNFQEAMTAHLLNQVQPGDVVVCHFSGYGTLVEGKAGLMLFDRFLPLTQWQTWLRSLPTPYITTILDTSFMARPEPSLSNFSSRSLPKISPSLVTPNDLAIEQPTVLPDQDSIPALPGIVIRANPPGQGAMEKSWDGFSAGLFTYALTQQLWQTSSPTIQTNLEQVSTSFKDLDLLAQHPTLQGKNNTPPFFLPPELLPLAHGAVIEAADNVDHTVTLWLGGLPTQVLANYGLNSLLEEVLQPKGYHDSLNLLPNPKMKIQIIELSGLQAKAKIISLEDPKTNPTAATTSTALKLPPVGTLLKESVRVLPRNISLQIGFDRQLTRVERVDATSAFANITGISLGKSPADYLFTTREGSYGLSTLEGNLLPTTQGQAGEAVKSAVSRLKPQLQNLLAIKLLHLTENASHATSPQIGQPQIRITQDAHNPQQYLLENRSDRPLYGLIFCSTPELGVISLGLGVNPSELPPHSSISMIIPEKLTTSENSSNHQDCHTYGIFSFHALTQTDSILKAQASDSPSKPTFLKLSTPLAVVKALYQDIQTQDPNSFPASASDNYILEINNWVTFWL